MASSIKMLLAVPRTLSLISTPSIRNTLSYANAPEIVICELLGVLSVTPGVNSVVRNGVRPTGNFDTADISRFDAPGDVAAADVDARTSTDCFTGAIESC